MKVNIQAGSRCLYPMFKNWNKRKNRKRGQFQRISYKFNIKHIELEICISQDRLMLCKVTISVAYLMMDVWGGSMLTSAIQAPRLFPSCSPPSSRSLESPPWSLWMNKERDDIGKMFLWVRPKRGMYYVNTHSIGQMLIIWPFLTLWATGEFSLPTFPVVKGFGK